MSEGTFSRKVSSTRHDSLDARHAKNRPFLEQLPRFCNALPCAASQSERDVAPTCDSWSATRSKSQPAKVRVLGPRGRSTPIRRPHSRHTSYLRLSAGCNRAVALLAAAIGNSGDVPRIATEQAVTTMNAQQKKKNAALTYALERANAMANAEVWHHSADQDPGEFYWPGSSVFVRGSNIRRRAEAQARSGPRNYSASIGGIRPTRNSAKRAEVGGLIEQRDDHEQAHNRPRCNRSRQGPFARYSGAGIDNLMCCAAQPSLTDDDVRLGELLFDELAQLEEHYRYEWSDIKRTFAATQCEVLLSRLVNSATGGTSEPAAAKRTAFIRPSVDCDFISRRSIRRTTIMISGWSDDGGHSCIGSLTAVRSGTNMMGRDEFRNKYSEVFGQRSRASGH